MSSDTILYLKLRRRGYDATQDFQNEVDERIDALKTQASAVQALLAVKQISIEKRVDSLVTEIQEFKKQPKQVEVLKKQVETLRDVSEQLLGGLSEKKEELQRRQQTSSELTQKLAVLKCQVRQIRPRYEATLLEGGDLLTRRLGNTEIPAFPVKRAGKR